jgi:ABC-2 type transport system ATP-binding protein
VNVLECTDLSVRYRRTLALQDCSLSIPGGHIIALVGPNGAGKTTLMNCAVGLVKPTTGTIRVIGGRPAGSSSALAGVAFVAQDAPLYKHMKLKDMISLARSLNRHFDDQLVRERLGQLNIPSTAKVGNLSGGQQAQVALTLALARHPDLLMLDEPLARLDPLARHDFMAMLMAAVSEEGVSVLFSSHVVAELERVADYLVMLANGRLQLAGAIDDVLREHVVLVGPVDEADQLADDLDALSVRRAGRQAELLVRSPGSRIPEHWEVSEVGLEELVLAYLMKPTATSFPGPSLVSPAAGL